MSAHTFECDTCKVKFPLRDRWAHLTPRPSDPTELVAVMWLCDTCGEREGGWEVRKVDRMFDEELARAREIWGDRVIFLTA